MKNIKRTLAVLLTLLMLIGVVPLGAMNAGAAGGVATKMDAFYTTVEGVNKGNYPYTRNGTSGTLASQCHGFACDLWYNVFGYDMYHSGKSYKAGSTSSVTQATIKNTIISNGRIGDIIRTSGSWTHSYVIRQINDSSVKIYEYGGDKPYSAGAHTVTFTYASLASKWSGKVNSWFIWKIKDDIYNKVDGVEKVTVSFNGNGGTPTKTSETFTVGQQYGDAFPSAVGREGYSFDGWYSSASGGSRYGRSSVASSGIKTLYAHWSKNTANVLEVNHTYKIYNKNSGLPLQTNGSSAGCYVCQREDSSASSQLWRVTYADGNGYYKFESLYGGNALDMDGDNAYGYRNHLQIWTPNTSNAQVFSLVKRSESSNGGTEYYSIHSKNSGRTCDVYDGSTEPGAAVWQWDCHLSDNQLFYFVEIEDRELRFYDNLNNNYLPSPSEVFEEEGTTVPTNCYSSRNTDGVSVTINPSNDSLTIKQISPEPSSDMKWVVAIGDSNVYGVYELDDTTVELHFKAKASVSGAKMYFRWGFDSTETGYYSVNLTTSWADYVLLLPRTRKSGNNLHPYIDKACTVEMKEIAMYAEDSQGYIGDTDAFSYQIVQSSVYDSVLTPLPINTKEGYAFDGWYTKRVGGTKVADGDEYYDLSLLVGDQNLYAHWVKEEIHTHRYTKTVKAPTCTEDGYTTYVCSMCGDSYSDDFIPAIGHDYKATVKEATCTQGGYSTYVCTDCRDTYIGNNVEPLGHNYIVTYVAETCTKDGYTQYTCSRCEDTRKEIVPAIGHQDGDDDGYCDLCSAELRSHDNPTNPTNPSEPKTDICKWCGKTHEGFFGGIIGFFHKIFAALFGARY